MNDEITSPVLQPTSRFEAAYRVLRDAVAAHAFPGCAFGVVAGDAVLLQDAVGHFTYDEASPAVAPDTVFDLASVTKVVSTTAAAMLLWQRSHLNLDQALGDMLPAFVAGRAANDYARQITLRHLLAHNSGLPGYVEFFRAATTSDELLQACFELQVQTKPGEKDEYSDPGFILLGKAIEARLGELGIHESLPDWAHREIYQPLAMSATGFSPETSLWPSIPPTEEDTTFRHRLIQGEVQDENAWVLQGNAGHAGLFSNVPDLLRFSSEIIGAVPNRLLSLPKDNLFRPATVKTFAERQSPPCSSRALGWDTPSGNSSSGRYYSAHSIGHLGYSGCSLWIDLEAGVAIVLLTNRTWPDRQCSLIRQVRPAFHDAVRQAL
jgi:serine-type D-Ala-D-Ala carboxypeptidase